MATHFVLDITYTWYWIVVTIKRSYLGVTSNLQASFFLLLKLW
jgi:hypothetical protein